MESIASPNSSFSMSNAATSGSSPGSQNRRSPASCGSNKIVLCCEQLKDQAMSKLMRFAASQENIDRVAVWLGVVVGVFGVVVAVVTIVAIIGK
jgi:hypothetical protein